MGDPEPLEIRRATPDDVDAVARLYVALKRHHSRLHPANPRYQVPDEGWREVAEAVVADAHTVTVIAAVEDRVVAFMKLSFETKPWGLSCEIDTMVVDDGHRGRGIGARLLREAERLAYERGAKGLRVDVLLENYDGRSFYEREGYEPFAVRFGKPVREPD